MNLCVWNTLHYAIHSVETVVVLDGGGNGDGGGIQIAHTHNWNQNFATELPKWYWPIYVDNLTTNKLNYHTFEHKFSRMVHRFIWMPDYSKVKFSNKILHEFSHATEREMCMVVVCLFFVLSCFGMDCEHSVKKRKINRTLFIIMEVFILVYFLLLFTLNRDYETI